MANLDAAFGLKPAFHLTGGTIRPQRYTIADQHTAAIGQGDLVRATGTTKGITKGTVTDADHVGVFVGCEYVDATTKKIVYSNQWPAAQATLGAVAATAWVIDDPYVVFEIQADEDVVEADIGLAADVVDAGVDTTYGQSGIELDSSNIGTGKNLLIYDIVRDPTNEVGSNFTRVLVLLNEHAYSGPTDAPRYVEA